MFLDQEAFDLADDTATRVTALESAGGVVALSADQQSTVTALADVTGLSVPVTAGVSRRFRFDVVFRTAATTTGIGLALTYPAASTFAATARIPIGADGAGGELQGWVTSSGDAVVGTGVQAINTDYLATVEGVIVPTATGVVQLRFRSEIAASAVTVRAGSCAVL